MSKQKTNNQDNEGLFFRIDHGVGEMGYRFDSAFGRLIPIIIVGLIILGLLSYSQSKFYAFAGIFTAILIASFIFLKIKPLLFMKTELVQRFYKMEQYGNMNKQLGPIEKSTIVKVQTLSMKARINNPNVSTEIKKLDKEKYE